MSRAPSPIIVLGPDPREARQLADWLRSAGLGMVSTARTCDEAIFVLGSQRADLLIIDELIPGVAEDRLLRHIEECGNLPGPAIVRIMGSVDGDLLAAGRAMATGLVQKPLNAHDVVVRIGMAMQRPDLVGRMDRDRDESADHLATARRMQIGLLPTNDQLAHLGSECSVGLSAFCRPGDAVGGDFWGAWPTGRGRLALAVADFAGHGLSAALNTFRLHAILSEQSLPRGRPVQMTRFLDARLHALLPRGQYATMVYAQLDPGTRRIAWCSSGGPPPLFVSKDGAVDLPGSGLPLGVKGNASYRGMRVRLPGPGILCLFSDGLYEGGPGTPDILRESISAALAKPAVLAAAGELAEATSRATEELELLRDRHAWVDHSDDVMAVCLAIGPTAH